VHSTAIFHFFSQNFTKKTNPNTEQQQQQQKKHDAEERNSNIFWNLLA
jgi:C4-dicarboxylate transporter